MPIYDWLCVGAGTQAAPRGAMLWSRRSVSDAYSIVLLCGFDARTCRQGLTRLSFHTPRNGLLRAKSCVNNTRSIERLLSVHVSCGRRVRLDPRLTSQYTLDAPPHHRARSTQRSTRPLAKNAVPWRRGARRRNTTAAAQDVACSLSAYIVCQQRVSPWCTGGDHRCHPVQS